MGEEHCCCVWGVMHSPPGMQPPPRKYQFNSLAPLSPHKLHQGLVCFHVSLIYLMSLYLHLLGSRLSTCVSNPYHNYERFWMNVLDMVSEHLKPSLLVLQAIRDSRRVSTGSARMAEQFLPVWITNSATSGKVLELEVGVITRSESFASKSVAITLFS